MKWTHTDELLARIYETLDALTRITIRANSKRAPNFGKPVHYKRPTEQVKKKRPFSGMPGVPW